MVRQRDFTTELKTYHQHEQELQAHLRRWVVIVGTEVVGVYDTFEEAIMTGGREHGLEKIFVHKITPVGHLETITRLFAPSRC